MSKVGSTSRTPRVENFRLGTGGVTAKLVDKMLGRRRDRTDVLDKLEQISGRLAGERRDAHVRG
ncbi:hypothetical protein C5E45_27320 [Nocardia nova]|uniref:Uncharacterized protein n=1 Tax=Nocardia nova TaxID=37330 RepID=A0A2S6AIW9_9NOCA|nr:hypothetical protein [Nocardia nova]PPJ31622.1 hypothetical protein C5E41_06850 [Nocardia nova]PPJ35161.1 hypothetical protein C5E45_27320 [Nocardia nova]